MTPGAQRCLYLAVAVQTAERSDRIVGKLLTTAAVAATALLCAFAPSAFAATPFTVGNGGGVHVVTGTDGGGHVVWGIPAHGAIRRRSATATFLPAEAPATARRS